MHHTYAVHALNGEHSSEPSAGSSCQDLFKTDTESTTYPQIDEDFELQELEFQELDFQEFELQYPQGFDLSDTEHHSSASSSTQVERTPPPSLKRVPSTASQRSDERCHEVRKFWRHHVSVDVPFKYSRDHLALERTFLGYFRTSAALMMMAATIEQFYPLQAGGTQVPRALTFPDLTKPMAVSFVTASILVVILGFLRFWRQQEAMLRGVIVSGGWEIWGCGILVLLVSVIALIPQTSEVLTPTP